MSAGRPLPLPLPPAATSANYQPQVDGPALPIALSPAGRNQTPPRPRPEHLQEVQPSSDQHGSYSASAYSQRLSSRAGVQDDNDDEDGESDSDSAAGQEEEQPETADGDDDLETGRWEIKQHPRSPDPSTHKLLLALLLLPLAPLSLLCLILGVPILAFAKPLLTAMAALTSLLKSLLLPFLAASLLYALLALVLLPLYRRHHQRYAQYLPLSLSTASTSVLPNMMPGYSPWETGADPRHRSTPASGGGTHTDDPPAYDEGDTSNAHGGAGGGGMGLRQRVQDTVLSIFAPGRWAEWRHRSQARSGGRVVDAREGGDEEMGDLVESESGSELGDDGEEGRRLGRGRRDAHERRDETSARRGGRTGESDARLSRELEEGFRDSSDEER